MRISDWSSDVCSSDLLRDLFQDHAGIRVLTTDVPAIEAYPRAATRGLPVHRVEYRQPPGRVASAALDTLRGLAGERSEERRVGKECVSTCRSRCSPLRKKNNNHT